MLVEAKMMRRAMSGELKELFRAGLNPSLLRKPYDDAFSILVEFFRKHNTLPGHARMEALCSHLSGFILPPLTECPDKASVYWEQISNAMLDSEMGKVLQDMADSYNARKKTPIDHLMESLGSLRSVLAKYGSIDSRVISPNEIASEIWDEYMKAAEGLRPGIPIEPNFPTLLSGYGKWCPGNMTTIVSRSGIGKTWLCLIHALYALINNTKVLVASMEMTAEEIMTRFATLAAMVDFDGVTKGTLPQEPRQKFYNALAAANQGQPPWDSLRIVNPDSIRDIEAVEAQADLYGSQLVVADAFYDFPEQGQEKRWEKINENLRLVRQFSLATGRHWFLTAQFNRAAAGIFGASDFNVGGSDYFNQISNNVIFLIQRPSDKKGAKVIVKLSKGRNSPPQPMMLHNWNFRIPLWTPINIVVERDKTDNDRKDIV